MSNIIQFPGSTTADISPDDVLENMKGKDLDYVLVLAWTKDPSEPFVAASSSSSMPKAFFSVELYKHAALNQWMWED